MKSFWLFLFFFCCLVPTSGIFADDRQDSALGEAPAETAENWLNLVDDHKYHQSWKKTSAFLQNQVPEDRWDQVMGTVRNSLGKVGDRKFSKIHHRDKLPGLPKGNYVVVQYATNFDSKSEAVETVYLKKEGGDVWKVCGYYVK